MSTTATDGSPSPMTGRLSRATPGCLEALAVRDFHCGVVVAQLASVPFGPEARHLHADGRSDVAGPDRVGDGGLPSACRVATGLGHTHDTGGLPTPPGGHSNFPRHGRGATASPARADRSSSRQTA